MTTKRPSTRRRNGESGSSLVEFTLVGIGLVFVLISIFEMSRGMWIYHTLAHASKEATRFLIVHGMECQKPSRNSCLTQATIGELAARIRYHGVGLLPDQLQVQVFQNNSAVIGTSTTYVKLNTLEGSGTTWSTSAAPGNSVQVGLRYEFRSALAMFWPGAGKVNFTTVNLGANSWDTIQF